MKSQGGSIVQLFPALQGADNNSRNEAERLLDQACQSDANSVATSLFQITQQDSNQGNRLFAAILFRRKMLNLLDDNGGIWKNLPNNIKSELKKGWVQAMLSEESKAVLKQIAENIHRLILITTAVNSDDPTNSGVGQWASLPTVCLQVIDEGQNKNRVHAAIHLLHLISCQTFEIIAPQLGVVFPKLLKGMNANSDMDIRLVCLQAFATMIIRIDEATAENSQMAPAVVSICKLLEDSLRADNGDPEKVLTIMVEISLNQPRFFINHMSEITDAMKQISKAQNLDDTVRQFALEFLICLCESSPGMTSNKPEFIKTILELCFQLMIEIEDMDIQEWNNEVANMKVTQDRNPVYGEGIIDRLVNALGFEKVLPIMQPLIPQFLSSEHWKYRHTGLASLTQVVEYMEYKQVKPICGQIISFLQDPHPRVRWTCINCVGQICSDHGPWFQQEFASDVLISLMNLMKDKQHPRVQAHAAAALINFCEPCDTSVLLPYLEGLLQQLAELLQSSHRNIQEQAITGIAGIADNVKHAFSKYYDAFAPLLFQVIQNAQAENLSDFRGRAVEALTFIGQAVGKQKFLPDAIKLMHFTLNLIQTLPKDNATIPFIVHSWSRVADSIKHDFIQFLDPVLEITIPLATQEVTFKSTSGQSNKDVNKIQTIYEDPDYKLNLDSDLVDLRKHAVHLLAVISYFCPPEKLSLIFPVFLKGIDFQWDSKINQCAALSLIACIKSAKRGWGENSPQTQEVFKKAFHQLASQLAQIDEVESVSIVVNCLKTLVKEERELIKSACTQPEDLPNLLNRLITSIEIWGFNYESQLEALSDPNCDDYVREMYEEDMDFFDQLTKEITLVAGDIICIVGNQAGEVVKDIVQNKFTQFWEKDVLLYKRTVIYFISDFVENIHPQFLQEVFPELFSALTVAVEIEDASIVQATFNALGIIGFDKRDFYARYIDQICTVCTKKLPSLTGKEWNCARENCIAALLKTAMRHNKNEFLVQAFQYLPLVYDRIEARTCHEIFVSTIMSNEHLLGQNFENLPRIVRQFLQLWISREMLLLDKTSADIKMFFQKVQTLPPNVLQGLQSSLNTDERQQLQSVLSQSS